MKTSQTCFVAGIAVLIAVLLFLPSGSAYAHCDTMNGPVVMSAQKALETGNVNLVLIWVRPEDEALIREAFASTRRVRDLSPEAKKLADMYFFETLVRIHRAGEGVAYTGLKPAGTAVEPGIAAADEAVEKGSARDLLTHLNEAVHDGLHTRFTNVMAKKSFKADDVAAGREYVHSYVDFIHYAERIVQAVSKTAGEHAPAVEQAATPEHHH